MAAEISEITFPDTWTGCGFGRAFQLRPASGYSIPDTGGRQRTRLAGAALRTERNLRLSVGFPWTEDEHGGRGRNAGNELAIGLP